MFLPAMLPFVRALHIFLFCGYNNHGDDANIRRNTRLSSSAGEATHSHSSLVFIKWLRMSMGSGKTMVLFFSAEMVFKVCRYLSCSAAGVSAITSLASRSALLAFCSPSAAITCKRRETQFTTRRHLIYPPGLIGKRRRRRRCMGPPGTACSRKATTRSFGPARA